MDNAFQAFITHYEQYGYPVLFLGVMLENAGVPVPGETAVLVAGLLSSPAGGGHFQLSLVILFTALAAILGDNISYFLGRTLARPRLQSGKGFLFLQPKTMAKADRYFQSYGVWTVFLARFITGLRVVGALAAGTAGMEWKRFLLANAAGALVWSVEISLLGYFFGKSWETLHRLLGWGGLILLVCAIAVVGVIIFWKRLHKCPGEPGA